MNFNPQESVYIGGRWQKGISTVDNINPSDLSDTIGSFSQASTAQAEEAIAIARKGQIEWEHTPLETRKSILYAIGNEMMARAQELGTLLSREEGKPLAEGKGEVYRAGQFFQYYAAEVLHQFGEMIDSVRPGIGIEVQREAVGVVAIISPWNFPTAAASWKIAPALAFGNSVIWKPASITPASAVALTEIIHRQGLPEGVFNLLLGSGREVGDVLIHSDKIDAISFTGSVDIGRHIAKVSSGNFVKCQLEMGSKNALVVADDADLDIAVECAISGSFTGTGQKCTASSRLIVFESVHDAFVEAMVARMKTLKVGHALEEGVYVGPVASESQFKSNFEWIEKAKSHGAELAFGGEKLSAEKEGYYMSPTLFINTKNEWDINQQEIFGPISCVIKAKNLDEAIDLANGTDYGLSSGIITTSLKTSSIYKKRAKFGCVMVNLATAGTDYHVPFGGRKQSSFGGREQGKAARDFYTIVKTIYQRPY